MMTKQSLSKIADVVLLSLLALAAVFVGYGCSLDECSGGLQADGS